MNQKKCDALLTPIVKKLEPYCLLCGAPTQVAHHFVHKSKSLLLRYDLKNLINLCNKCHLRLHWNESYEGGRIVKIKGLKWFKYLEKKKGDLCIGMDYKQKYAELKELLASIT